MKIVLIGAGNIATNLGKALLESGNDIVQVCGRTHENAAKLADMLGSGYVTDIDSVSGDADVYILSVTDSAMLEVARQLCHGRSDKVFLHTAGSVPMNMFENVAMHYGVLYPLQTFSKNKFVDFSEIPCFIEGNDEKALQTARMLADGISSNVRIADSETRKHIHLAAVFACNFVNHCYAMAAEILEKHDIPFNLLLPLIDETARKAHAMPPREAQTGPAARGDENTMNAQMEMLGDNLRLRQAYRCLSESIVKGL